jgi:hypothetical protein
MVKPIPATKTKKSRPTRILWLVVVAVVYCLLCSPGTALADSSSGCTEVVGDQGSGQTTFRWARGKAPSGAGTGSFEFDSDNEQGVFSKKPYGSRFNSDGPRAAPVAITALIDFEMVYKTFFLAEQWYVGSVAGWLNSDEIVLTLFEPRNRLNVYQQAHFPVVYNTTSNQVRALTAKDDFAEALAVSGSNVVVMVHKSVEVRTEIFDGESGVAIRSLPGVIRAFHRSKHGVVFALRNESLFDSQIYALIDGRLLLLTTVHTLYEGVYAFRGAVRQSDDGTRIAVSTEARVKGQIWDDRRLLTVENRIFNATTGGQVGKTVRFQLWQDTVAVNAPFLTIWRHDGFIMSGGSWVALLTDRGTKVYNRDVFLTGSLRCASELVGAK